LAYIGVCTSEAPPSLKDVMPTIPEQSNFSILEVRNVVESNSAEDMYRVRCGISEHLDTLVKEVPNFEKKLADFFIYIVTTYAYFES
jgi:hypothetical protein